MDWFKLYPQSIVERVKQVSVPPRIPTLTQSIIRGVVGFTLVSLAGFLPWVLAGKWFYRNPSELAMYTTCAVVFMSLSGALLHPLIIGPGSLKRFYIFFSVAFALYAAAWIAGWMVLRGQNMHLRSIVGLLAGTAVMGVVFALAFDAWSQFLKIAAALFVLNSVGYFVGGWVEGYLSHLKALDLFVFTLSGPGLDAFMKLTWGLFYGIGLGAGLGYAFYSAQTHARFMLQPKIN